MKLFGRKGKESGEEHAYNIERMRATVQKEASRRGVDPQNIDVEGFYDSSLSYEENKNNLFSVLDEYAPSNKEQVETSPPSEVQREEKWMHEAPPQEQRRAAEARYWEERRAESENIVERNLEGSFGTEAEPKVEYTERPSPLEPTIIPETRDEYERRQGLGRLGRLKSRFKGKKWEIKDNYRTQQYYRPLKEGAPSRNIVGEVRTKVHMLQENRVARFRPENIGEYHKDLKNRVQERIDYEKKVKAVKALEARERSDKFKSSPIGKIVAIAEPKGGFKQATMRMGRTFASEYRMPSNRVTGKSSKRKVINTSKQDAWRNRMMFGPEDVVGNNMEKALRGDILLGVARNKFSPDIGNIMGSDVIQRKKTKRKRSTVAKQTRQPGPLGNKVLRRMMGV